MDPGADGHWTDELLAESGWVRALARRLVADAAAAEDIVQETWLAALKRRPSAAASLRPWLSRVLRAQVALRRRGRTNRRRRELDAEPRDAIPSPEELTLRSEAHECLVRAVRGLREPYRAAILLHYYEGLTAAEIARRSGVPSATIRSRLHRGLEQLRAELDAEFGDRRRWCLALAPILAGAPGVGRAAGAKLAAGIVAGAVVVGGLAWLALSLARGGATVRGSVPGLDRPDAGRIALEPSPAPTAREPLGVPADAAGTALVRLVDERTGEPLPDYIVEMRGPRAPSSSARTDRDGELALDLGAEGPFEFRLIDDPRLRRREAVVHGTRIEAPVPSRRSVLTPNTETAVVRVPAGPTYVLDLDRPAGVELADLRAHLRSGPPAFDTLGWSMHLAPVRDPGWIDAPWVRFAALESEFLDAEPPWRLDVASADGFFAGSATVDSISGRVPGRVRIALSSRARLHGRVRDAAGPVTDDVLVRLVRADGTPVERRTDTDGEGAFALEGLEPGDYRLVVECPRYGTVEEAVRLEGGVEALHDVDLARVPVGGTVEALLTSRTGSYDASVVVALVSTQDESRRFYASAAWEELDGGRVAPVRFEDVPSGRYRLEPFAIDDQLGWQPSVLELTVPSAGARLVCLDDVETTSFAVLAVEAESGEPLEAFRLTYAVNGGTPVTVDRVRVARTTERGEVELEWRVGFAGVVWALRSGTAQLARVPADGTVRWVLSAPARVPVRGDERAFVEAMGGGRVARVRVESGFARRLRVVDEDGRTAVEGVELWADGVRVAFAGDDGVIECRLDATPRELVVRRGEARVPLDPEASPRLDPVVRVPR